MWLYIRPQYPLVGGWEGRSFESTWDTLARHLCPDWQGQARDTNPFQEFVTSFRQLQLWQDKLLHIETMVAAHAKQLEALGVFAGHSGHMGHTPQAADPPKWS